MLTPSLPSAMNERPSGPIIPPSRSHVINRLPEGRGRPQRECRKTRALVLKISARLCSQFTCLGALPRYWQAMETSSVGDSASYAPSLKPLSRSLSLHTLARIHGQDSLVRPSNSIGEFRPLAIGNCTGDAPWRCFFCEARFFRYGLAIGHPRDDGFGLHC